jgi:hypothetical protein
MNAAWLLVALMVGAENEIADQKQELYPFTLDQIAAGAKNDAFVDEYLKGKSLQLFGTVKQVERMVDDGKSEARYRVVIERQGHEERAVDVAASFLFTAANRKELAQLEPGITKVTIEGTCISTQMQSLVEGMHFSLNLDKCKIVDTPEEFTSTLPAKRPQVVPNVTPDGEPGSTIPYPRAPQYPPRNSRPAPPEQPAAPREGRAPSVFPRR